MGPVRKILLCLTAVACAWSVSAGPFRSIRVATQKTLGEVTAFDLTIGPSAAENPLYLAWGAADGGETTTGWDHVEKLQDVGPGATAVNVPISTLPEWGTATCRAVRFFLLPGDMYVPLESFRNNGGWIHADYLMDSRDEARCRFKLTTTTSQYGAHLFGYKRNWENQFYCAYAGGAQMMGGVCYNSGTGNFKTTGTVHAYSATVCEAVVSATEVSFYTNGVLHQQSTAGYPGEPFTVAGDCTLFHSEDYVPQSGKPYLGTHFYSFNVTRDGEAVIDFIPCKTNGVVCVYDAARQRFFGTTNGTFVAGTVVEGAAASALVTWEESEAPKGAFAVTRLSASTERIGGSALSVGLGATSVDVYLAYAPHGEALPAPTCVVTGLARDEPFTFDVTGLSTGTAYDYTLFFRNDRGIAQMPSVTGTFSAYAEIAWTGAVSTDWSNAANWDKARLPAADDDVTIPAGSTVVLTNATPTMHALALAGTLTTANWTTRIDADDLRIPTGGLLTCAGPFADAEMSNRVWIVCRDLTVEAGGAIDVCDRGFDGGRTLQAAGYGPGAGDVGASHGGCGGGPTRIRKGPYDDPSDPTMPGSGGKGGATAIGMPGGGAVKIDATGRVTVDGTIDASATRTTIGTYNTLGSGGSISIGCASFAGRNGKLLAEAAASPITAGKENGGYPGGGGRIAIRTTAQTDGLVSGMTISVLEGLFGNTPRNEQDAIRTHADLGTLWFTDKRLLESLGTGISGQILNFTEYTFDDLAISSGHVRLAAEGVKLTVAGDLTVTGAKARLELGGYCVANRVLDFSPYCGTTPVGLAVGGDMTVGAGGRFDVYSAETNGLDSVGAAIDVAGTLTVGAGSKLTAGCDEVNGGAPKFTVGNLVVEATGVFTADARGFAGGTTLGSGVEMGAKGKGPGGGDRIGTDGNVGKNKYIGGGHGGVGGWSETGGSTSGLAYGDEWRPTLAGSGGAGQTWAANGGAGGGVIDVLAKGTMRIDGTVSANGGNFYLNDPNVGGGAGGSVFLQAPTFSGAATGVVSANGQDRTSVLNGGAGAGGRVAIWTGAVPYRGFMNRRRVHTQPVPFVMRGGATFEGSYSAVGGVNTKEASGAADATAGTCWFVNVDRSRGLVVTIHQ